MKTTVFLQIVMRRVVVGVATGIVYQMILMMRYFQTPHLIKIIVTVLEF